MRKVRARLLDKERELRLLELKVQQERETGELAERLSPKHLVNAVKEMAEKAKPKEYRPAPTVSNARPLKDLLATEFQRKILNELDSKRDQVCVPVSGSVEVVGGDGVWWWW
jgi:hypothetical protein